jgi:hypothetical protein
VNQHLAQIWVEPLFINQYFLQVANDYANRLIVKKMALQGDKISHRQF